MRERVRAVIATTFGVDPTALPDDASAQAIEGWDSLRQIELVLALELEFGVRVPSDAVAELTSVEAIESFLAGAGAA